ncbi:MAG TPA: hypothetical protein PKE29_11010 [Phycisphaerales bacterium]|mgnify:CR=1 FL=1|nr:hypothetical protein [Phycisphaerales bacterium]
MIHPAPTTRIDSALARGTLAPGSPGPGRIIMEFPNTNYQMHLVAGENVPSIVGERLIGTIRVESRRIDAVNTGGKYVEPVYGRPRRVQGRVVSWDDTSRTLVVDAGMPIHLQMLDDRQNPSDFGAGTLVSCDVLDGASFTPAPG